MHALSRALTSSGIIIADNVIVLLLTAQFADALNAFGEPPRDVMRLLVCLREHDCSVTEAEHVIRTLWYLYGQFRACRLSRAKFVITCCSKPDVHDIALLKLCCAKH